MSVTQTRILTALAMALAVLPTGLLLSPSHFSLVLLALSVGVLWEWLSLTTLGLGPRWALCTGFAVICASVILSPWIQPHAIAAWPLLGGLLLWPVLLGLFLKRIRSPRGGWGVLIALGGMLACVMALWVARIEGMDVLLSLMAVVWVADTAAYFAGRSLGGPKLAPRLSPAKTWSGALGAVAGVLLFGQLAAEFWSESWPARVSQVLGLQGLAMALVFLTMLSIAGDLHQSLLKRQAGVKDSGRLLPGHGGLFDRFDAMLVVLPAGMAVLLVLSGGI